MNNSLDSSPEDTALVVWEAQPPSRFLDFSLDLGGALLKGAAFAAIPEAVGDSLYLSGAMKPAVAEQVKITLNTALIAATGSWMGAGVSWATTHGLRYMGMRDTPARVVGSSLGFLTNTTLSPWGVTLTALNYGAGMLGILAEKKIMNSLFRGQKHPENNSL